MLALLTVAGIAVTLTAYYILTTRTETAEAFAGEAVIANVTNCGRIHAGSATRTDWQLTTVSALCDAEELLDILENQGFAERELVVLGNSCFAVRWR